MILSYVNFGLSPFFFSVQNFLMQGGVAPLQTQKSINFDRKGSEIVHLWFPKMTSALLQPPKIKSYIFVNSD